MKNNEEFRASVFEKAAAYEKRRKEKSKARARVALALVTVMLIFLPVLYIPMNFVLGNHSTAASAQGTTRDPLANVTGGAMTKDTTATIPTTTVFETTEQYTQATVRETTGTFGTQATSSTQGINTDVVNFAKYNGTLYLGAAQGEGAHYRVFQSEQEFLACYPGGAAELKFGAEFWEKYALVAVYLELDGQFEPYSKAYLAYFTYGNSLIFDISLAGRQETGEGKYAWLAYAGVSKELAGEELGVDVNISTELEKQQ
ncbi:MAG: hypothetical protein IJW21_04785 [Clostridia bacterium]|nr:hypothetical protein [Clostridia bacterium]